MGYSHSKLSCLYFPAQSGKTQKVKERIELFDMLECFGEEKHINLFLSSNNRLLVQQTGTRFDRVYNWISGNNKSGPGEVYKLAWDVLNDKYDTILMCSNKLRFDRLINLIETLEQSSKINRKINIWIDEADSTINLWSKYENVIHKEIIEQVTLVSATFDPIFKKYKRLQVIGSNTPYPECYRCLKDSIKIIVDFAGSTEVYIEHVLNKYPKLFNPGMKAFIPGNFYKSSHDKIADILVNKFGFAVLIMNGSRKQIFIPNASTINIDDYIRTNENGDIPEEFKETLARIYMENELYNYPFAITGLECIKRGVTFQSKPIDNDHKGFIFDYGIIPLISKGTEAYQLISRLFGNIGDFPNYKQCEIYSTSSNFSKIQKQESMVINISKMVYENLLESVGKEELREAMNIGEDSEWSLIQEEFFTRKDANNFLHKHGCPRNHKENKKGDFLLSSVTNASDILYYPDVIKQLKGYKKTSTFDTKNSSIGKKHSRMYICYKDLTNSTSLVFIIRIIEKIS